MESTTASPTYLISYYGYCQSPVENQGPPAPIRFAPELSPFTIPPRTRPSFFPPFSDLGRPMIANHRKHTDVNWQRRG
jgi:hypothetical protein